MIFLDPWVVLIGGCFAIYGFEQLLVNVVRYIDHRGKKPKGPTGFLPPKS